MSIVDQIAAVTGLTAILNRQQAKQAGLAKELACGTSQSSIANALAQPFETESLTLPVVQRNIALADAVLAASDRALSSVDANLNEALTVASQALSAPPAAQGALARQFNGLLDRTRDFVDNAAVNGLNLVGGEANPMTIRTTTEGGQVTVPHMAADAGALGVSKAPDYGWDSRAQIQQAIDEILSALNEISSAQSKFAAVRSALVAASQVNQSSALAASASAAALIGESVGASVLDHRSTLAEVELATSPASPITAVGEHNLRHARNILGLLDK